MSDDRIVVGVDGSVGSDAALAWACAEASRRAGIVTALWVAPAIAQYGYEDTEGLDDELLAAAVDRADVPTVAVERIVRRGSPVVELQDEAKQQLASLLVVGRRGAGRLARLAVGSVSSALAQHPRQPLVVVPTSIRPTGEKGPRQHVTVGIDGSDHSLPALRWAAEEAERTGGTLEVILAWSMPLLEYHIPSSPRYDSEPNARRAARNALSSQMDRLRLGDRSDVESGIHQGDAAEVLLHQSSHADLLVVGTRGLGYIHQHVLGSTSHAVLEQCGVPLVIVPTHRAEQVD